MCVCVRTCVHRSVCVCICVYIHNERERTWYARVWRRVHLRTYEQSMVANNVFVRACESTSTQVCACASVSIHTTKKKEHGTQMICVCVCVCVCICVYTYIVADDACVRAYLRPQKCVRVRLCLYTQRKKTITVHTHVCVCVHLCLYTHSGRWWCIVYVIIQVVFKLPTGWRR